MKTFNKLYKQIWDFENLFLAAQKARKGKKYQTDVARFDFRLEQELFRLQDQLKTKKYKPGKYRTFHVYDPKKRMISAAPYRDRVLHHALCNIIEPIFEKTYIFDSYSNRIGKGTHAAINRYQHFARKYPFVLKSDIRKFFPSIDHEILKGAIRQKIKCTDTLWLINTIIDNSNPQEENIQYYLGDDLFTPINRRHGLPIGNLTSQYWANVYMNRFDHYVKEGLRAPGYIRYVDDFVVFATDKQQLHSWKKEIQTYLSKLRLSPHPNKTHIHQVEKGVPFLGFRLFPYYRYVNKSNRRRYERYLRTKLSAFKENELSLSNLEAGLNSWLVHVRFGQSQRLERKIFQYINEQGVKLVEHPRSSWRVLEQQQ